MMGVMRWVGVTIVLVGVGWAAGACGSSVFACSSDEQCQGGAPGGVCQPQGYCSFPDDICPSGHRFGDAAPEGVANVCVEPGDGATTSGGPEQESSDGIEPPGPEGTPEGTTTTPGDGTTTKPVVDDTSTGPELTTGIDSGMDSESMTTGPAETCSVAFVDEFEEPEIAPEWYVFQPLATLVWLTEGQLAISISPAPEWVVGGVFMDVESMAGGWARVLVTQADDSGLPLAGGVVITNGTCQLQLFVVAGGILASVWNDELFTTTELAFADDPGVPLWLQIRQDANENGVFSFEWSPDAVSWNELAAGSFPECGDLVLGVTTGINVGGELEMGSNASTRYIDQFELCLP